MDVQGQKGPSAYFDLQKKMSAQLFRRSFELSTESQQWSAVAFRDGNNDVKQDAIALTCVEAVPHKSLKGAEIE